MEIILIILSCYLLIGMFIYFYSSSWVDKNDPEFYEEIDNETTVLYFISVVVFWLPDMIEFLYENFINCKK